jgi:hypothetical protein
MLDSPAVAASLAVTFTPFSVTAPWLAVSPTAFPLAIAVAPPALPKSHATPP